MMVLQRGVDGFLRLTTATEGARSVYTQVVFAQCKPCCWEKRRTKLKEYTPREVVARGLQSESSFKHHFITNAVSSAVSCKHYNVSLIYVLIYSSSQAHHIGRGACTSI